MPQQLIEIFAWITSIIAGQRIVATLALRVVDAITRALFDSDDRPWRRLLALVDAMRRHR